MSSFFRKRNRPELPSFSDRLQSILKLVDENSKEPDMVKRFRVYHNMLIATCIELSGVIPLKDRLIVRKIIEKCRYN